MKEFIFNWLFEPKKASLNGLFAPFLPQCTSFMCEVFDCTNAHQCSDNFNCFEGGYICTTVGCPEQGIS